MRRVQLWLMLALSTVLAGCISGRVLDAVTANAVVAAQVSVINGSCTGAGCTGNPVITTSDSKGFFLFDAYDDTQPQEVGLSPGEEAIELLVSRPGYEPITLYHTPAYQEFQDGPDVYHLSEVGTVYLCPIGAPDTDGDSICDAAETRYGTDPTNTDTDGDNLSDTAELYGYSGADLKYWGASPLRKDKFIEVDYYPGLKPFDQAITDVIAAFANAPVSNPDGSTGINLIIDVSDEIEPADVDPDLNPVWTDFDVIKNKYYNNRRAPIFHYGLFANQYYSGGSSGISRGIPAHDFVVSLGTWSTPGGTLRQQTGTLMHEFGHNIGLRHGGNVNQNYKFNYLSIMSYAYQLWGLRINGVDGNMDYSRLEIATLNEASLSESAGMEPVLGSATSEAMLSAYTPWSLPHGWHLGNAAGPLDFDHDGIVDLGTVAVDLDSDGFVGTIHGASQNDWDAMVYHAGGAIGDSYLGATPGLAQWGDYVTAQDAPHCMTEFD